MNRVFLSVVLVFVVVGGLLVFQATRKTAALVLVPSELLAHPASDKLSRIRVGGRVSEATIDYATEPALMLKFSIQDAAQPKGMVLVEYPGVKPDMFQAGRDVLIDGEYSGGVLHANKLLTQCPSKYEPPSPTSVYKQEGGKK